MRQLTDHIANPVNQALKIEVVDEPGEGGASHVYKISWDRGTKNINRDECFIWFQDGPIREHGVNGITQEALLAIVIDRLQSFQAGPFACMTNELALLKCREALDALKSRTRERIERGVEGTNQR